MTDTPQPGPQAAILRPAEIVPHERGGGARTVPLVTSGIGSTSLLNGITEFAPGGAIPLHTHNCEESVMVLEGEALVEIAGVPHRMGVHDTTWVPADVPHRFVNAGPGRLRIFWTYASVDATRTLVATGDTRRIDAERR
ncbi:cupin domain-containing protein [Inquilinus sp.]|jgi:quercetin dioxygenase-like cupin family protein|uniref:cupin domain-containing protein n=1 Tax=Inquilinus sp. TaxID=1932117 RepID=UPI00378427FF